MSFPGKCEWCGGRQVWTVVRDIIYVACVDECQPFLPGFSDLEVDGIGLEPPTAHFFPEVSEGPLFRTPVSSGDDEVEGESEVVHGFTRRDRREV